MKKGKKKKKPDLKHFFTFLSILSQKYNDNIATNDP